MTISACSLKRRRLRDLVFSDLDQVITERCFNRRADFTDNLAERCIGKSRVNVTSLDQPQLDAVYDFLRPQLLKIDAIHSGILLNVICSEITSTNHTNSKFLHTIIIL